MRISIDRDGSISIPPYFKWSAIPTTWPGGKRPLCLSLYCRHVLAPNGLVGGGVGGLKSRQQFLKTHRLLGFIYHSIYTLRGFRA
ncbi:hypothetical protein NPIL_657481 [Nephila pilipes]|uniref:Uncharacterized protein n=1 Tax=Nephila pilipes TaxID=299642 RepID=A0A8X6QFS3_NEPPI|nr:hypothetical protein NPIL_657481 [Nephila pilipes]